MNRDKKRNKKAALSVETLIIIILGVLVLMTVMFIFSSGIREVASSILNSIKDALGLWKSAS